MKTVEQKIIYLEVFSMKNSGKIFYMEEISSRARNIAKYFGKEFSKNIDEKVDMQIDLRYVYENSPLRIIGYNIVVSLDPNPIYNDYNILIEYNGKIVFNEFSQLKKELFYIRGEWEQELEKIHQDFLEALLEEII